MKQDKIWDYYQNEAIESFDGSYSRLSFLIKRISYSSKVLNIGVGGGVLERIAQSKKIDVYSLDPSEKTIERLHEISDKDHAKVGYSQNIPFPDNYFDSVVMSEVLEHLSNKDISDTLKEIDRVLKKNGIIIGTVPYREVLSEQIVVCPKCGDTFHRWGHVQSFDEDRMHNLLSKNFSKIIVTPKLFISWKTLNYKGKIAGIVNYLSFLLGFKKSGLNLYFEGIKN